MQVDINEDVVETGKSNNQTSIKQKIQTRGRGKVSKNPTLKDEESEDESVKITNKKKEPIKKGRAKQANNKNEDTEPKQEREIKPKGKSGKTTKNKKEVENSESEKVSEPIKKKTTKKTSGKNKDTESKPEKEVKPTLKRKAAKTIVNKKEGSESDNVSEPSEKPVKISRMKKPTGKNMDMEAIVEEEVKPAKKGRAAKTTKNLKKDNESDEVPAKKGRVTKAKTTKENEVGDTATRKNKTSTSYDGEDFSSCDSKNGKQWNFKISNWNVDGIRAWLKKGKNKF